MTPGQLILWALSICASLLLVGFGASFASDLIRDAYSTWRKR